MRAVQNPVRRLHGHPTTVGGRFQPSPLAGDRSRSSELRSPNKGTEEHPTPNEPAASSAKRGTEGFQRLGAGGGEEKKRLDEILSGFVVTESVTTKPDKSGGFANRSGREECSHQCAVTQAGAHTKAARSAPPRRRGHGTTRSLAVKVAPLTPRKPYTRDGEGVRRFRSGSREQYRAFPFDWASFQETT